MHVNSTRFNLTDTEQARLRTFEREVWYNSELCNHCFARVREIEANPAAARLSKTSLKNIPADFYERTEQGTQEHCGWDHNRRFGTCFCLECGGDLTASHRDLSREKMKTYAKNLAHYVADHSALQFDPQRFFAELLHQKNRRDTQGRESQMFAVAFVRSIRTPAQTTTPGGQTA